MSKGEHLDRASFESAWRRRFQEFASLRDDDAGIAGWSETGLDVRFRRFQFVWSQSTHGCAWLDVGCGAGTYTRHLASLGKDVVGLDYCLPAVAKAKARDNWNCCWAVADAALLPLKPGGFDGVLCFGVTQALADAEPAVRELIAQVHVGGEVWIDVLNEVCVANLARRMSRWLRGKPMHLRYESPRRMKRLMEDLGLVDVQIHWIPILPTRLRTFQPIVDGALVRGLFRLVPSLGEIFSHSCMFVGRKAEILRSEN